MPQSTIKENGQTTIPAEVRKAMNLKPQQQLLWEIQPDGTTVVRPRFSALELYGSLKPRKKFPGIKEEKEQVRRSVAKHAANEVLV